MQKPAATAYPVHEFVQHRWSPRAFDAGRVLDDETIGSLMEAARWTPSAYNEQPWAFVIARRQDEEHFRRLLDCLTPTNQEWARNASALMLACAKLRFDRNSNENRHAAYDLGQAAAWMTVQAEALGLHVHQMAGIDVERCRRELAIPEGWEPMTGIAVGYYGDAEKLAEPLRQRERGPRVRKDLTSFVFDGRFGQAAGYVDPGTK